MTRPIHGVVPPHDLDAEAAVVSASLLDADARDEALAILRPEHFYDPALEKVWSAVEDLAARAERVDFVTVAGWLRERGEIQSVGGAQRLAALVDGTPAVIHVGAHAEIVWWRAMRRKAIRSLHELVATGYGRDHTDREWFSLLERTTSAIGGERPRGAGPRHIREHLEEGIREIVTYQETGVTPAVPFPLEMLTERTGGGMRPGELWTIAGRPGQGKTALADQCAIAAASPRLDEAGNPSGITGWVYSSSLEMLGSSKALRMVAGQARVEVSSLRVGFTDRHIPEEQRDGWTATTAAASALGNLPIYIDDDPATPERICAEARKLARKAERAGSRLALVVVDYLQILDLPASDRRDLAIAHATMAFQRLSKELRCPVLQLAQLNRNVDQRKVPRPFLSDLRESGTIEQDSDAVLFVYRPHYYDPDADPAKAEIIVGKQRNGPTGVLECFWDGPQTRFSDDPPDGHGVEDDGGVW